MTQLNLPRFDIRLAIDRKGRTVVYDPLRAKWIVLTPEEWVRQHFVHFLISNRSYPQALTANEVGLRQNGCVRRCDTVVYGRQAQPVAIIEYKAPEVQITPSVFDQAVRYNMEMRVGCIMVSNGLAHYCCRVDSLASSYHFLRDIPSYPELLGMQ
ncbi:MAG: type I restriction enzyme HsdR N-terminal domain-containing protein [Clostridium sp.]|nr:type I restriction enzyme HsdR N-terminal domain-containing protein [Clostridium sp.]